MTPPTTIIIKSDLNELKFEKLDKGTYIYKYSKSKSKKGQLLGLSETELIKLININT